MAAALHMNILHLDTGGEMRGGQWQALLLMQALARRGHTQQLLARAGSPLIEKAREAKIEAGALRRGVRLPVADLVHVHDAGAHTSAAFRLRRAPLVVSRRVAFPVRRGFLSRWKYRRADHFVAISEYVARELHHAGIPEEKVSVVYDGVRLPDLSRAAELRAQFRQRYFLPADGFVAGALTTFGEKPIVPLIEIAEQKRRLNVLIRGSDLKDELRRGNIIFMTPQDDISPFLFACDVLVHLSESEGLGSAALLAMAHGLPVIASDVGGLPEIVRPGETGLLVRNIVEELDAALEKLYADREEARAMGGRGRRFVEQNASDDIMARKTEQVYLQVLGKHV